MLKISASQMLFGNMLNLDKGVFTPISERSSSLKPLSNNTRDSLAIQDNLLKASAEELLGADLLHMTTKKQIMHKKYSEFLCINSLSHRFTANLFAHEFERSNKSSQGIKSRSTLLNLINVSDMKPFVFDSALVDPLDIARRDQMEFFIVKNSNHRGKLSQ